MINFFFCVLLCLSGLGSNLISPAPPSKLTAPATTHVTVIIPQPDLTGSWVGKLYQNEGGIAPDFEFSMDIVQNGIFVRGTSFVRHEGIWAEIAFSGYQKENGSVLLTETKILRSQKPEDLSWCMKEYELRAAFNDAGMLLSGPWWGDSIYGACIPGSVRLTRKIKTA
ncbi:hypothetical protein [Neolewinella antarctica]|uniref:Uncharacterized protein n=1 Tax=Neolewinella antarctica TaxID=442734 RepID=A0ABX0XAB7_9BACT|nr:hypothetical protein [Neolewinella antarctica]NJC26201.1 hypothetical protein [Neolewinella antarctica]